VQRDRNDELFANQLISASDRDITKAAYDVAFADAASLSAQMKQAAAAVDTAKANLGYTKITAPMAGEVVSISLLEGQTLNANQQAPNILRIADISTVTVWAQVSEADIVRVKPGQDVYFTILGDSRRWNGKVRQILPTPELINNVVFYDVLFDIPNPERELKIQMTAQVFIVLAQAKGVLLIPAAAIGNAGEGAEVKVRVLKADGTVERARSRSASRAKSRRRSRTVSRRRNRSSSGEITAQGSKTKSALSARKGPVMPSPLLELKAVSRTYTSGGEPLTVLKEVSLTIQSGEFVAIMGASGSGKSTLMNIIGCLDKPSSGTYSIRGVEVASLNGDALAALRRDTFGFIFQRYNLMSDLSAVENAEVPAVYCGMAKTQRAAHASDLLRELGLGDRLQHHPSQLSGGQQQRVSIARALMNGGPVILADEPTGALDSQGGKEVMAILEKLHGQGHTIIVVTHDSDIAAYAHRLVRIADGRITSDEPQQKGGGGSIRRRLAKRKRMPSRVWRSSANL
jgi:ABC-type lipoprotein export system ATPase subunit